jgi:hypothetical protein
MVLGAQEVGVGRIGKREEGKVARMGQWSECLRCGVTVHVISSMVCVVRGDMWYEIRKASMAEGWQAVL